MNNIIYNSKTLTRVYEYIFLHGALLSFMLQHCYFEWNQGSEYVFHHWPLSSLKCDISVTLRQERVRQTLVVILASFKPLSHRLFNHRLPLSLNLFNVISDSVIVGCLQTIHEELKKSGFGLYQAALTDGI